MASPIITRKSRHLLLVSSISLLAVAFLVRAVDWRESIRVFRAGASPQPLFLFVAMALVIALMYALRWRLLLDGRIRHQPAMVASVLCLGGNMFLPGRGGDLLRVHYSHVKTGMSHAETLSRLFIEKLIDLVTIAAVGAIATLTLRRSGTTVNFSLVSILSFTALAAVLCLVILIRFFDEQLLRWLHPLFRLTGKTAFLERHVAHLVRDAHRKLTLATMALPAALTLLMWISVYACSYLAVARLVGISLGYQESLLVLFAGALGLMLPAAPSGVGTFHASVVSAFMLLGRSSADGLLFGTAIHFLFFVAYALPAAILYGHWRISSRSPAQAR